MQKRLYRSRNERVIFGVAGGLGQYFDVDPVLFRVAFVVATFLSGAGLLAYIILAIVIPSRPLDYPPAMGQTVSSDPLAHDHDTDHDRAHDQSHDWRARSIVGIVLVVVGIIFLLGQFGLMRWWGWGWGVLWPVILIALGLFIIVSRSRRS